MLQVTADKLNLRNTPFADPSYANWIGDMNKGEIFIPESAVEGIEYKGSKYWYKDTFNKYASLTGLGDDDPKIPWSLKVLGIPHVWIRTKGEGVKVAIIDSGIDLNNNDLNDAAPVANRFNVLDGSTNVQDNFFHGTYCSSILASRGNNGLMGVAPACELIVIKIANTSRDYNNSNELKGIQKAIDLNADIISMSFGNISPNEEINLLLKQAIASGKICLASTGDNNKEPNVEFPANLKGMISVGNILCINQSAALGEAIFQLSDKSNGQDPDPFTEGVTILAPGEEVIVYDLQGQIQHLILGHGGTSFSTPFVAGIAALWLSLVKEKNLNISNYHQNFKDFIIANANKCFAGYDPRYWGYGIINPLAMMSI